MRPNFASDNLFNEGKTNAKLLGNLTLIHGAIGRQFSNVKHILCGQLGSGIGFTDRIPTALSIFGVHILHVVLVCTCEKMFRIDTRRVVTMVTNKLSSWNRTIMEFIAKPMCSHQAVTNLKGTIPCYARPNPTGSTEDGVNRTILINVAPKAFNGIFWLWSFSGRWSLWTLLFATSLQFFQPFRVCLSPFLVFRILAFFAVRLREIAIGLWIEAIELLNGQYLLTRDASFHADLKKFFGFLVVPKGGECGMLGAHQKLPFWCLIRGRVTARRPVLLLVSTPVIIPYAGADTQ